MARRRAEIGAILLGLVVCLALAISLRELAALRLESVRGGERAAALARAVELTPRDWRRRRDLASFYQLTRDLDRARAEYRRAIEVFPGCPSCWVGLAETLHASGQDPSDALERAIENGRSETRVRTRAAVLYEQLGRREVALREFRAAIGGRRDDKRDFYELLHRIYDTEEILDHVVSDADLAGYFAFAVHRLDPEPVESIWKRRAAALLGEKARSEYVDYLVARGLLHDAWAEAVGPEGPPIGTVSNGDFELDSRHGDPFGWRLRDGEGSRTAVARCPDCTGGERVLAVVFDGEHDPHYLGASVRVPVVPGARYRLHARVRAEEITSSEGPGLVVVAASAEGGDDCRLRVSGERFRLTTPWRATTLDFRVPPACEGIRVLIERRRSDAVNRLIGGEFAVDDIRLERLDG